MNDLRATIDRYLQRRPVAFRVCLAPGAARKGAAALLSAGSGNPQVFVFDPAAPPLAEHASGILVLTPADLVSGPVCSALLAYARAVQPARPVLWGGSGSRDVLVEAINTWRIFRVVAEQTSEILPEAVRHAHEALCVELALNRVSGDLIEETDRLQGALAALRTTGQKLVEIERQNTLGRAARGVMPVVASYLGALEGLHGSLSADLKHYDPELQEMLASAVAGTQSLRTMLQDLLSYADHEPASARPSAIELDKVVASALSFARFDPLACTRSVRADLAAGVMVRFDNHRLRQILLTVLRGVYQTAAADADISVRTSVVGKDAVVQVGWTGPEIAEDARGHLFDPFFTVKGDEGLGLGSCRQMLERYGGAIDNGNAADGSPVFRIRLPRLD